MTCFLSQVIEKTIVSREMKYNLPKTQTPFFNGKDCFLAEKITQIKINLKLWNHYIYILLAFQFPLKSYLFSTSNSIRISFSVRNCEREQSVKILYLQHHKRQAQKWCQVGKHQKGNSSCPFSAITKSQNFLLTSQ